MGYAAYVGRVGALAVALGIGTAIASTPGVAWAEPGSPPGSSSDSDPGAKNPAHGKNPGDRKTSRAGKGSQPGTSQGSAGRGRAGSGRPAAKPGGSAQSEEGDDRGAGVAGSVAQGAGVSSKPPAEAAKQETGGAPASGSTTGGVDPAEGTGGGVAGLGVAGASRAGKFAQPGTPGGSAERGGAGSGWRGGQLGGSAQSRDRGDGDRGGAGGSAGGRFGGPAGVQRDDVVGAAWGSGLTAVNAGEVLAPVSPQVWPGGTPGAGAGWVPRDVRDMVGAPGGPGSAFAKRAVVSSDVAVDRPNVVSNVLRVLGSLGLLDSTPTGPVDSTILWAMLACRSSSCGKSGFDAGVAVVDAVGTGLVVDDAVEPLAGPLARGAAAPSGETMAMAMAAVSASPAFVQVNAATPQTSQSSVGVTYADAQLAGDTNIVVIGWRNTTSNITSVTDSAGNVYKVAVPTARGSNVSQAIYYAANVKPAQAGTNTVTVRFNKLTPYVDVRALEYSGLDPVSPFNVGRSASGISTSASSGIVTTTSADALIFGAGTTGGAFSGAGSNFTSRIITPDGLAQDRVVTAAGPYSATAPVSGAWVMQVAAFKAADTTAPTVSLTGPAAGATVRGTVSLTATASDNVGVTKVQFMDGTQLLAEDPNSPYSVSWNTTTADNGSHTLTARAYDAAGNTTDSPVNVTVDNTVPTVSVTAPADGATVSGSVNLAATASDDVGEVVGVQFLVNGTPVGAEDATAPYEVSWNAATAGNGTRVVTARARDAAGNSMVSAPVSVTVANPDVTVPTVSLTAPSGPVSGTVSLSASASDNVGVVGVQLMVDGMPIGAEDTSSPYGPVSFNTATVKDGFHTLSARARDAAGNINISEPISVTVTNGNTPTSYVVASRTAGTGPSGAAVTNDHTYVINYDSNNVTVMETATNEIETQISVGRGPLSVAASELSKKVYVSNSLDNSVSVIDATTNSVVDTIYLDVPDGYNFDNPEWGPYVYDNKVTELAVNREGTRLYVNATDGSVRVIDTDPASINKNKVIHTAYLGRFNDLKVSPDGTRLYGTPGLGLTVIDTATMTAVGVQVGPVWDHNAMQSAYTDSTGNIAVSPDGTRVYVAYSATTVARGTGGHTSGYFITDAQGVSWKVTGGSGGVSVIDTDPASANYNKEIARVIIPGWAQDLAVSGGRLYVTEWDDMSVTVVDTTTNAIVGRFTTDQTRSGGRNLWVYGYYEWWDYWDSVFPVAAFNRYVTAGSDGKVYVTDYGNGQVYMVTPGSPIV